MRLALKGLAALAVATGLTGCATFGEGSLFPDVTGMPIATVTERLGLPDDELTVSGEHVYLWENERQVSVPSSYYYDWRGHYYYRSPLGSYRTVRCTLKLVVDDQDRVSRAERDGHVWACADFARNLRPAVPS